MEYKLSSIKQKRETRIILYYETYYITPVSFAIAIDKKSDFYCTQLHYT